MRKAGYSIRVQVATAVIASLFVLALFLVSIDFSQHRELLISSERRVGLTLIRSVNNTINSVRAFISTLNDIAELDTRLAELVDLNANIDFIAVTDAEGVVIFHSDREYRNAQVPELAHLPEEETVLRDVPGFSHVYLTSMAFDSDNLIDSPEYQIVIASAEEPILDRIVTDAASSILVTALFALGAAGTIIFLMQRYVVGPLEVVIRASEAIEAGDLSQQANVTQNNEIGQLAHSFNRMTNQLAVLINELETRVKARTHELEIARDQAEQASRAKSEFLSNMSHELRTPLNLVIGYTSSMLNMPQMYNNVTLPDIYRDDVQLIRESGRHLLTLINDVLDLSKVEAGKLEMNFAAVDLNETFESAVALSLGLIGDKPLQLRQNYPDDLPRVWADSIRIRQILLNLLSNAVKYTPAGTVTLFAEAREHKVHIAVTDTGPGIPASAINSIFDRFEQIQNHTEIQGTGLGLDISQRLAQLHGSEITIDSKVGIGSTFAFDLTIATPEQLAHQSQTIHNQGNAQVFETSAEIQILSLVVAADNQSRQYLRQILEKQGIIVVEATNSPQCLDMARGLLPDFILIGDEVPQEAVENITQTLQEEAETRHIPIAVIEPDEDAPAAIASLVERTTGNAPVAL